ncbi:MAG: ABC transporter permease, partial [Bacteroidota bacterium]
MLKNYFKVAMRTLSKNRVYSVINISGLAIGFATVLLIALWVYDELNYNNYFKDKSSIAQVYQHQSANNVVNTLPTIPRPLEFALREDFSNDFENIVMSSWNESLILGYNEKRINFSGNFMQSEAPYLLELNILNGEKNGLQKLNSVMLAESTAKALFGDESVVGKTITVDNSYDLNVTAVYKNLPKNSSFSNLDYIISWETMLVKREWTQEAKSNWNNSSFQMFVKINSRTSMQKITEKIIDVKKNRTTLGSEFNPQIFLFPMKDWYLRNQWENGVQIGGRIENVWLFGIIGAFILLLACINFVN